MKQIEIVQTIVIYSYNILVYMSKVETSLASKQDIGKTQF